MNKDLEPGAIADSQNGGMPVVSREATTSASASSAEPSSPQGLISQDRYEQLIADDRVLYLTGSPVLIVAAALLMDTQTGTLVARAKFKNISDKPISALTVDIAAEDSAGRQLQGIRGFQYLDLGAMRGDEFGADISIRLPDAKTHSFSLIVREAIFADGSFWEESARARWEVIAPQQTLQDKFGDDGLIEMYQMHTNERAHLVPARFSDLWLCACGEVNHSDDESCLSCGLSLEKATLFLSEAILEEDLAWYRDEQRESKERAAKRVQERKRAIKHSLIATGIVVAAIAALLVFFGIVRPAVGKLALENPSVGNTVYFGDIYWQVLDVQDGRALLISQDIVEKRQYNDHYTDTTWEECSLRAYLNNEFLSIHFSEEEQGRIALANVVNDDNPKSGTLGGNDTQDKVFILSIDEAKRHFSGDAAREAKHERQSWWWWLRSPGGNTVSFADLDPDLFTDISSGTVQSLFVDSLIDNAAVIHEDGSILVYGTDTTSLFIGVRPVLWVNL
jgi:hypothetical protein